MKPLALEANRLAPFGTTYTWVPREQNKHADRLANEALDGKRSGVTVVTRGDDVPPTESEDESKDGAEPSWVAWRRQVQTTLVLVRHGVTDHTRERRFSGGLQSKNPGLSDEGRDQIRATADWLAPLGERVDAVVASPVRRARESGEILAERLGVPLEDEPGFAEMEFGTWDGMTFDEVAATQREALEKWLGSLEERPGGGESLVMVQERVLAALERLLARHAGRTVVVASHVTPIKVVVAEALQAPLTSQFRMELRPASVTVVTFFTPPDGDDGARRDPALRLAAAAQHARARRRPLRRVDPLVAVQTSLTTTSSGVPARPGAPTSACQPSRCNAAVSARTEPGLAPSSSRLRTSRPLVALLKWLTTVRRPSASCSTRTVTTRRARSGSGRQNPAYVVDLRSTSSPPPTASRTTAPSEVRHTPATGPRPGSEASPESRYAGMRSPGRTRPKSDETTATRVAARRRASAGRSGSPRAS